MTLTRRKKPLDFTIVKRQIISEYLDLYGSDRPDDEWNLSNCIEFFRMFYSMYFSHFGRQHPNLSNKTICKVLFDLPRVETQDGTKEKIPLRAYPEVIEKYFRSHFQDGCDYTIQHFTSGKIRLLICYEILYHYC